MRYVDTLNPAMELPYERRSVSPSGPVVYRYATAIARRTHLDLERATLAGSEIQWR